MESSTIIARATPGVQAARAIIRLSGAGTPSALASIGAHSGWSRGARRERVTIGLGLWIPVLVARFPAPRSYTGEDSAEILLAGNLALVDRILERLVACPGVRLAHPGEFTARAFLAGKLSLEQAEGVAAMIAAENAAQLGAARELLNGATGANYRAWTDRLAALLALVEAGIDFTDQEDVVAITPADLVARLGALSREIEGHLGGAGSAERRAGLPRVVLHGEPNAGKSTLFNALLGRERAVVSDEPGTTRDGLVEVLHLARDVPGAGAVQLVDAPGVDPCAAGVMSAGAQGAMRDALARADIVVYCDPHGGFGLSIPGTPGVIRVQTKGDVPGASAKVGVIRVCALDGWNLDLLRRAIAEGAWKGLADALAIVPRHRSLLLRVIASIHDVCCAEESGPPPLAEVVAASLRSALDSLGEITGRVSPDEVLGRVFATFCVGK